MSADYDFPFMVRMATQARAKLERWNRYHEGAAIYDIDVAHDFVSAVDDILGLEFRDTDEHPNIHIGNKKADTHAVHIIERWENEKERILKELRDFIMMAYIEYKGALMRVSQETAAKTAKVIDRGSQLQNSLHMKEEILREYYMEYVRSHGIMGVRISDIYFLDERPPFDNGTVLMFVDGVGQHVFYSRTIDGFFTLLQAEKETGYNTAYYASNALGEVEIEWLQRKMTKTR